MIGTLRIKGYLILTTEEQVKEFVGLFSSDHNYVLSYKTVIIDSFLMRSLNSKVCNIIHHVIAQSRRLDMSFIVIGDKDTRFDKRTKLLSDTNISLRKEAKVGIK